MHKLYNHDEWHVASPLPKGCSHRASNFHSNCGLIPSRPLDRNLPLLTKSKRVVRTEPQSDIGQTRGKKYEVKEGDICRAVAAIADLPSSTLPDSPFILALGTPTAQNAPPQTGTLAQRAPEEWERTLCENKAVAILAQMQAGRSALIQKDGSEMLIAIVLDRPLADAKALVDDPAAFTREMTKDSARKAKSSTYCANNQASRKYCCGSLFCFLLGAILIMTHKMSSCMNPHCW